MFTTFIFLILCVICSYIHAWKYVPSGKSYTKAAVQSSLLSPSTSIPRHSYSKTLSRQSSSLRCSNEDLNVGDFLNTKLMKIREVTTIDSKNLNQYKLDATIKAKEFNTYLVEYKQEMKRRKVTFPGFRSGNLPPYVMGDVRRYLICYGLEYLIGQLCNLNNLELRAENGDQVQFGEDSYYQEIIQKDFRDYDFIQQRDAWREGQDFTFSAIFFASEEGPLIDQNVEPEVVDTEIASE